MFSLDDISKAFIKMVAVDPDLDFELSRLLSLFALPLPDMQGGYLHHGS